MVAQLAQFSSVEQAQQTNQHLIDLANAQSATSSASLSNLVGRDCNVAAGDFQLDHGTAPPIQVTSTSAMKGASVVITDDSGKELRRIAVPAGATSAEVAWDGKTAAGTPAAPGTYHVTVDAGTTTGTITSQWHGRVDAVELTSDGPRLRMGGVLLAPGDVRTIGLSNDSQNLSGAGVKQ
jgi:flagellar hook assembly protein FlgD